MPLTLVLNSISNYCLAIHRGHFGVVRLVTEGGNPGKCYAMKVMGKSAVGTERAMAERNALAASRSDWVTKLRFAFQNRKNLYLVMEYCPGGDLRSLLDRQGGKLPLDMTRFYLAELTLAVNAVHKMGYAHNDVKPENILIDRFGHIKLTDFGSADPLSPKNKSLLSLESRRPVGTPNYVSPEMLRRFEDNDSDSECDPRKSDFWSMGVVGHEMATGSTPFADENSMLNTYSNIMNHRPNLPTFEMRRLDRDLKSLLEGLLTDVDKRLGYEQLLRHQFFLSVDWDELCNSCAPFVPDIRDIKDTSYFDLDRSGDATGSPVKSPIKTPKTPLRDAGGKAQQNVVIGFSYAGKHAESLRYSRQFGGDDCSDIVASLRRQNDDLRMKMTRMEQELKAATTPAAAAAAGSGGKRRRITENVDGDSERIQAFCEQEGEDLRKTIARLEKVLETERGERNEKEKQSLEMLSDLKKKWQDREESRVEKIRSALEKSEKKRSQAEKDLLDTHKLLEEKHKEMEAVLGVKTSLKNKVKEYRTKLHEMAEQFEEERRKSAILEKDSSVVLERETLAMKKEKLGVEKRVKELESELQDTKTENARLTKRLKANENIMQEQKVEIKSAKQAKELADHDHRREIDHLRSSRKEMEDGSGNLQSEIRRLERENESARRKLKDKDEKVGELEKVLKSLEEKIRPIDRLSRSMVGNSPRNGECENEACKKAKEDLSMQKVEVRILERKVSEMESRIKFLREVMFKEEKEAKEKLDKELTELKGRFAEMETELEASRAAKESAERKLERLDKETASLRQKANYLRMREDECRSMKRDLERAQNELGGLREAIAGQDKLQSNCTALKAACLELEDQNSEYETVVEKLSAAADRLGGENERMHGEVAELARTTSSLKVERNDLKSRLIQAESRLKEASAKHDDVEAMYRSEERSLNERLSKANLAKESQSATLESLKEQLSSLARNFEHASEESAGLKGENRRLREEASQLTTNVYSLKESNLKLHAVIEETMDKIGRRNQEIKRLEEQHGSLSAEKERKEAETNIQVNQLRKLVDHLKSKNDALMIGPKAAKGRKRLADQNWALTYEELQEQLDQERHKVRMLNEQVRILNSPRKSPNKGGGRK